MGLTRKYNKKGKKITRRVSIKSKRLNRKSRSKRLNRKSRRHLKGGYGKGANPFIGKPWIQNMKGNYYKHIDSGIGVGGVNPYYGDLQKTQKIIKVQKMQKGGKIIPQDLVNIYRESETNLGNLVNKWKGRRVNISPRPEIQPIMN